ncbi:hypothetical protein pb186bvf_016606 [Paramecium bursaria]
MRQLWQRFLRINSFRCLMSKIRKEKTYSVKQLTSANDCSVQRVSQGRKFFISSILHLFLTQSDHCHQYRNLFQRHNLKTLEFLQIKNTRIEVLLYEFHVFRANIS